MGATAQARSTLTLCPFNSTIHLTRRLRKRLAHHRRDFLRDVTLARFQSLQEPFAQCDAVLQRYVTPGTLNDGALASWTNARVSSANRDVDSAMQKKLAGEALSFSPHQAPHRWEI